MSRRNYPRADTLVALLKETRDLSILREHGWYRIPVNAPLRNVRQYSFLAFYQPSVFGRDKWCVRYYGLVKGIRKVKRAELLPREVAHPNRESLYYRIDVARLEELARPIISKCGRRVVFIPTTFAKLQAAQELNDLFHESPLEDDLWEQLKREGIERL